MAVSYTWLVPHTTSRPTDRGASAARRLSSKTRLAFTVSSVLGGRRFARYFGSDRSVRPRQRTQPPRRSYLLYDDRPAREDRRQGARKSDDAYHDQPDGLSGNDVGQMSAWYVLSSLIHRWGRAGRRRYFFGSPLRQGQRVRDGVFTVIAHNTGGRQHIQRVKPNGEPYAKPHRPEEIAAGGTRIRNGMTEPALWYEL